MPQLVNGVWQTEPFTPTQNNGEFEREDSRYRDWISADGHTGFPAQAGRYHVYVSPACPWSHRVMLFRVLKKLEEVISLSWVDPYMGEHGWTFHDYPDPHNGFRYAHELYTHARPAYTGNVTVPILWDTVNQTIVNNESSEIIRMLNSEFAGYGADPYDFYPDALRADIDAINDFVYHNVNNGVYRTGFATTQTAYERAFDRLFSALDELELRLSQNPYLVGTQPTEADWRLFPTLVRFDAVYHYHFKCNRQKLSDYPHLWRYTRRLYQTPGVAATVEMEQTKIHYYSSHPSLNPSGIVPKGPVVDFSA